MLGMERVDEVGAVDDGVDEADGAGGEAEAFVRSSAGAGRPVLCGMARSTGFSAESVVPGREAGGEARPTG